MADYEDSNHLCQRCGLTQRLERINIDPGISKQPVRYCTCRFPGLKRNLVISPSGYSAEGQKSGKS